MPEFPEITHVLLAWANLYLALRSTCLTLGDMSKTYLL